jgi:chromatin modification-related protein EAF6
VTKGILRSLGF